MSAIFGILRFNDAAVAARDLERMGAALRHRGPDAMRSEAIGCIGLGHCLMRVNREDRHEAQPLFDDADDLALVADCRIDNRGALAAAFGWDAIDQLPDSAFILQACKRWGAEAPEHLVGDFAFALWNGRARTLMLARDPMGQRHLHFHHGAEALVFATDLVGLWPIASVPQAPDMRAIGRRLFGDMEANRSTTYFQDVAALAGGSTHIVDLRGAAVTQHYWSPRADPAHQHRDEDYYARTYRDLLEQAVACRTGRLIHPPALSLSGGIDSSTIAALAGPPLAPAGLRLQAVTSVAVAAGTPRDARAAAEACARAMPHVDLHLFQRGEETAFDALERNFLQEGTPYPTNYVLRGIAAAARAAGARLLMDGHGGDYTVNFRGPLDWSAWIPRGEIRRAWREANAVARASGRWRLGALVGRALPRFLPERLVGLAMAVQRGFRPRWHGGVIARAHGESLIADGAVNPHRIRGSWQLRQGGHRWMRHILDIQRLAPAPADAVASGLLGLELTRPFHDVRLVEFALAIPETLLFRDGHYRMLARRALSDVLPAQLLAAGRLNDRYQPDFIAMRQAQVAIARADLERLSQDPELAALIDFTKVATVLAATEERPHCPIEFSAASFHAIAAARFVEWSRHRNSPTVPNLRSQRTSR